MEVSSCLFDLARFELMFIPPLQNALHMKTHSALEALGRKRL